MKLYPVMAVRLEMAGIVAERLSTFLENESSCNGAKWAKTLQKILIDKTERHFDIDLSELDSKEE